MIEKIFSYLEGLKGVDVLAEQVLGIMVPGAKVTHHERSDDPSAPWHDTEFKFLGKVFTLRFVVVNGAHVMELMHYGNCIDIPSKASLPSFILENYFHRYRDDVKDALGGMFKFGEMRVNDPNGTEIEIKGELVSNGDNKYDVVFCVHVDDETIGFTIFKDGEVVAKCNQTKIDGTAYFKNKIRNFIKNFWDIQNVGTRSGGPSNGVSKVSKELYDRICNTIKGSPITEIQTHCTRKDLLENNPGIDLIRDIEEAGGYAVFDILGTDGQLVQLVYSGESDLQALETGIRGVFVYSQQLNNASYCVMHDLGIEK